MSLLLLFLGCPKYASITPAYVFTEKKYEIAITGTFSNLDHREMNLSDKASEFSIDLNWVVSITQVGYQRDDSLWVRLEILESSYVLKDQPPRTLPNSATGRVIDLRIFPWGELLEVRYADHLAGKGRLLDVFEPVLPALFPSPPNIEEGQQKSRTNRWPIVEGEETIARSRQPAEWIREKDQINMSVFSYQGLWQSDDHSGIDFVDGDSNGRLWVNTETKWLERHELNWQRELRDPETPGKVQHHHFQGEIWRIN